MYNDIGVYSGAFLLWELLQDNLLGQGDIALYLEYVVSGPDACKVDRSAGVSAVHGIPLHVEQLVIGKVAKAVQGNLASDYGNGEEVIFDSRFVGLYGIGIGVLDFAAEQRIVFRAGQLAGFAGVPDSTDSLLVADDIVSGFRLFKGACNLGIFLAFLYGRNIDLRNRDAVTNYVRRILPGNSFAYFLVILYRRNVDFRYDDAIADDVGRILFRNGFTNFLIVDGTGRSGTRGAGDSCTC